MKQLFRQGAMFLVNLLICLTICRLELTQASPLDVVLPPNYQGWSSCDVGRPLAPESVTSLSVGSYLQIFTTMKTTCSGFISEWWFYNVATIPYANVYFSVWQRLPINDADNTKSNNYYLIGYNAFNITNAYGTNNNNKKTGFWQRFEVYYYSRIRVRPGYVIGIHYDAANMNEGKLAVPHIDASSLKAGSNEPIELYELYSTVLAPYGHAAILEEMDRNRFVSLPSGELQNNRLPLLLAHVTRDTFPQLFITQTTGTAASTAPPTMRPKVTLTQPFWSQPMWIGITQPYWVRPYGDSSITMPFWSRGYNAITQPYWSRVNELTTTQPSLLNQFKDCSFRRNPSELTCVSSSTPVIRWFYDGLYSQLCQMFVEYPECNTGRLNNFDSEDECRRTCERPPS